MQQAHFHIKRYTCLGILWMLLFKIYSTWCLKDMYHWFCLIDDRNRYLNPSFLIDVLNFSFSSCQKNNSCLDLIGDFNPCIELVQVSKHLSHLVQEMTHYALISSCVFLTAQHVLFSFHISSWMVWMRCMSAWAALQLLFHVFVTCSPQHGTVKLGLILSMAVLPPSIRFHCKLLVI